MNDVFGGPVSAEVREVQTPESLRNIALRVLAQIKENKEQRKLLKEQEESLMNADQAVREAERAAEPYTKAVTKLKKLVKDTPEYATIGLKGKELGRELKGMSETLTNHLVNYTRLTGSNILEDEEGRQLKIKHAISVLSGQMRLF